MLVASAFNLRAQPQFEFAGSLLGEGHGDDLIEFGAAARDHRDDPADQRRGFARARGGFDNQRGLEIVADTLAHR